MPLRNFLVQDLQAVLFETLDYYLANDKKNLLVMMERERERNIW